MNQPVEGEARPQSSYSSDDVRPPTRLSVPVHLRILTVSSPMILILLHLEHFIRNLLIISGTLIPTVPSYLLGLARDITKKPNQSNTLIALARVYRNLSPGMVMETRTRSQKGFSGSISRVAWSWYCEKAWRIRLPGLNHHLLLLLLSLLLHRQLFCWDLELQLDFGL